MLTDKPGLIFNGHEFPTMCSVLGGVAFNKDLKGEGNVLLNLLVFDAAVPNTGGIYGRINPEDCSGRM